MTGLGLAQIGQGRGLSGFAGASLPINDLSDIAEALQSASN